MALVVNELTTNAAKYGALSRDVGRIAIRWVAADETVAFERVEQSGPKIEEVPEVGGFGSKLLRETVSKQFGGTIEYDWNPNGQTVRINVPVNKLSA
jgi:two-component sensor histidine kinase